MTERVIRGMRIIYLRCEHGGALVAFVDWRKARDRRRRQGIPVRIPPPKR